VSRALDAATDALATARIVRLVQVDEIPVGKARELVLDLYGDKTWSDLLRCNWCLSVWVAGGVVLARHRWPRLWSPLARILAGSQVAGMLAEHHP
jgi:Protein of unknown function (DUF1360)